MHYSNNLRLVPDVQNEANEGTMVHEETKENLLIPRERALFLACEQALGGRGVCLPPSRACSRASALPTTRCFIAAHKSFLCSTQSERMHMDKSKLVAREQMNVVPLELRTHMMDKASACSPSGLVAQSGRTKDH